MIFTLSFHFSQHFSLSLKQKWKKKHTPIYQNIMYIYNYESL